MNSQFYDKVAAVKALDVAIEESKDYLEALQDPAIQHLNDLNIDPLALQAGDERSRIWRVGPIDKDGVIEEEFAFRMQGAISKLNLRPGDVENLTIAKALNTSQQISIVGLGSSLFRVGLAKLRDFHELFVRHFPAGSVANWVIDQEPILNASNRYFTSLEDDPLAVHVPFEKGVDPLNKLQSFVGDQLVHSSANVVKYYKRTRDNTSDENKFEVVLPSHFRVGDIVEVDASVIAFKSLGRKGEIKMHCILNAVTLLDATYSKAAEEAKRDSSQTISLPKTKLHRKNPYSNEGRAAGKKPRDVTQSLRSGPHWTDLCPPSSSCGYICLPPAKLCLWG
ncbi:hypothetical protein B0H13DRAFT_2385576 [Mycena leptocephala]|nr:hypothetical protein B0H13DRAFT_2385576 [Mycena leptocephala]